MDALIFASFSVSYPRLFQDISIDMYTLSCYFCSILDWSWLRKLDANVESSVFILAFDGLGKWRKLLNSIKFLDPNLSTKVAADLCLGSNVTSRYLWVPKNFEYTIKAIFNICQMSNEVKFGYCTNYNVGFWLNRRKLHPLCLQKTGYIFFNIRNMYFPFV